MSTGSTALLERIVVPVASEDDAAATAAALVPYVDEADRTVVALHVVEKAAGALDKASVEQRERRAEAIFDAFTDGFAGVAAVVETDLRYGTDVAGTVVDAAHDVDASAVVFTPRGGGLLAKFLSGDVTHKLVANSDVPVLTLPERADRIETDT